MLVARCGCDGSVVLRAIDREMLERFHDKQSLDAASPVPDWTTEFRSIDKCVARGTSIVKNKNPTIFELERYASVTRM